ncbi:hypothetical protein LTA6_001525 [Microbacterium sp. LTA6]|uniref:hypothetical protein n=1 Tax=Microbacterium sp. LTA6 TaxID=3129771 RepID=UPI003252E1EA
MSDSLRQLLTPVDPSYELPLHDGWERIPATDPRVADRLPQGADALSSIEVVMMPAGGESPLALPILERRVRGENFGTLDALVEERLADGAGSTLGDPAILRHRARETAGDVDGYVVRYLLATPGSGRRRGVEFLVAFPALPDEKLQPLETLYDGIIASGSWRMPGGQVTAVPVSPPEPCWC